MWGIKFGSVHPDGRRKHAAESNWLYKGIVGCGDLRKEEKNLNSQ